MDLGERLDDVLHRPQWHRLRDGQDLTSPGQVRSIASPLQSCLLIQGSIFNQGLRLLIRRHLDLLIHLRQVQDLL